MFKMKKIIYSLISFLVILAPGFVFAAGSNKGLANIAVSITGIMGDFVSLIFAIAAVAGSGFLLVSFFKFKQHKDNPTQVPLGQPIALLMIGVGLVWLPFIAEQTGETVGANNSGVASPTGNKLPSFFGGGS